jgi:limonene-1,2-epoxide hydrolase
MTINTNPTWLNEFITIYQNLNKDNLSSLESIYHQQIFFQDPLHQVNGLDDFIAYFEQLYSNIISCEFDIKHTIHHDNEAAIYWQMSYQHPKLNHGELIIVSGNSHLKAQHNKITFHRDYLDAGAMLYEHIPLLGSAVRFIKKRASQ